MLEIKDTNVYYGRIHALRDVSLTVPDNAIVSLVGANGAGKTTLMMTLAGVLKSKTGSITMDGTQLATEANKVVAQGLALVPERRRLYANLTVYENLMMGAHLRKDKDGIKADIEKMIDMFPILGQRQTQYAGTLSGGEQQMLAIARGLMSRPKILLMDEPSLGLAPIVIRQVFDIVKDLKNQGLTILLAEQNANKALEISDYAYVLETGKITKSGTGAELLADESIREAYLGAKAH